MPIPGLRWRKKDNKDNKDNTKLVEPETLSINLEYKNGHSLESWVDLCKSRDKDVCLIATALTSVVDRRILRKVLGASRREFDYTTLLKKNEKDLIEGNAIPGWVKTEECSGNADLMKRCKGNWEVVLVYMPEMSDVFELSIYNEGTKLTLTQLQEVVDEAMTELVEGQEATMEHITASTSGVTTALAGVVTDQGERQMGVLEGLAGYVLRLETRLTQDAEQRRLETEQHRLETEQHRLDMSAVLNALPALVAAQQERANALPAGQQQRALARVPHKPFELSPSGADRASPQEGTAYTPSPLVPCVLDDRLSIFDNQQRTQPPTELESPMSEE